MNNRKEDYLLSLFLTLFIISASVCVVIFFKPFYTLEVNLLHIDQYVGMSKEVIIHNYSQLIDYQSFLFKGKLVMDNFSMSNAGRIHFEEVKNIFVFIQYTAIITGLISVVGVIINTKKKEYRYLGLTAFFTVVIPSVLGFLVALDFDQAFVLMHQLLFNNDYWIFDPRYDPVINILPESFFCHCFILIVLLIIISAIICYMIYKKQFNKVVKKDIV